MVSFPLFPDAQTRSFSKPLKRQARNDRSRTAASILSQSVIFSQEACEGVRIFPNTVLAVMFCAAIQDIALFFTVDFALQPGHSPAPVRYSESIAAIPV